MKVAIISDIHDNFHNLIQFFKDIENKNIQKIICLGDLINNGIAKILAKSKVPVISIWGNNDGDKTSITKTSLSENSNLNVGSETFDFIKIEDKSIFITHYPMLAKPMAKSGEYNAVFYGHNHKKNMETINNCLMLNPGDLCAQETGTATYAIYDSETNTAEIIEIKNSCSTKTDEYREFMKNN